MSIAMYRRDYSRSVLQGVSWMGVPGSRCPAVMITESVSSPCSFDVNAHGGFTLLLIMDQRWLVTAAAGGTRRRVAKCRTAATV